MNDGRCQAISNVVSFLMLAFALGVLFQLIRGGFTSFLVRHLSPEGQIWAYACYGSVFILSGLLFFFYDEAVDRLLSKRLDAAVGAGFGAAGILLAGYGNALASCLGMTCLALFAAEAFSIICSRFSLLTSTQSLIYVSLAFFCSFPFSFAVQIADATSFIGIFLTSLVFFAGGIWGGSKPVGHRTLSTANPKLPVRFLLAIIALCVIGNFFSGVVDSSRSAMASSSVYWSTFLNGIIAVVIIVLLKLGLKVQRVLFWCWFLFSVAFFAGVVLLTLPSPFGIQLGLDIVATFRVALEFLLFALIVMITARERLHAAGLIGGFFLLPTGFSVFARHIAAPFAASAGNGILLDYLPTLVLLITFMALFSWYSFANKVSFDDYFNPVETDSSQAWDVAIASLCEGRGLTPRERDILEFIAQGYTMKAIGERLVISLDTVRTHCRAIYRKLDVHSKQEIIDRIAHTRIKSE